MSENRVVVPISFKALERVLGFPQGYKIVGTVSTTPEMVAGEYLEIVVENSTFPVFVVGQTLTRYHATVRMGLNTSFNNYETGSSEGVINLSKDY